MKRLTSLQGNGAVLPLAAAGGRVREECVLFEVGTRGAHRPQCPVASGVPARPVWNTFGDVLTSRLLGDVPYWLLICTWGSAQTRDLAIPVELSSIARASVTVGPPAALARRGTRALVLIPRPPPAPR